MRRKRQFVRSSNVDFCGRPERFQRRSDDASDATESARQNQGRQHLHVRTDKTLQRLFKHGKRVRISALSIYVEFACVLWSRAECRVVRSGKLGLAAGAPKQVRLSLRARYNHLRSQPNSFDSLKAFFVYPALVDRFRCFS